MLFYNFYKNKLIKRNSGKARQYIKCWQNTISVKTDKSQSALNNSLTLFLRVFTLQVILFTSDRRKLALIPLNDLCCIDYCYSAAVTKWQNCPIIKNII